MSNFETWWEREGQEFLFALNTTTDDDIKLVAEIAWKNGAYCAEQAEQGPVGVVETSDEWGVAGVVAAGTPVGTKLYAAPVRTKDLSDEEITNEWESMGRGFSKYTEFARAVIAADREKNK